MALTAQKVFNRFSALSGEDKLFVFSALSFEDAHVIREAANTVHSSTDKKVVNKAKRAFAKVMDAAMTAQIPAPGELAAAINVFRDFSKMSFDQMSVINEKTPVEDRTEIFAGVHTARNIDRQHTVIEKISAEHAKTYIAAAKKLQARF